MRESFQNHRTHAGSKQPADPSDDDQSPKKPAKSTKPILKLSNPSKPSNVGKHISNKKQANDGNGDSDDDDNIEDKDPSLPDSNATGASGPYNDGKTEIEDGNHHASEDDEEPGYKGMFTSDRVLLTNISSLAKGKAPAKALTKKDRVRLQRTDSEVIPRPVTKKPKRVVSPPSDEPSFASASTSTTKKQLVIQTAKRGQGGCVGQGGRGGRVAEQSSHAVQLRTGSASESESKSEPDAVVLSDTSGETTSASEDK